MRGGGKYLLLLFSIAWLVNVVKHFYIIPTIGEDRDISGFEFRIKW